MAIEYTGNAIPAPGYLTGDIYNDDEILYSTHGGFTQKGVTLEPGQGVLLGGTVLARKTSTKRYVKYAAAGSDGTNTAIGILRKSIDTGTDPAGQIWLGNIVEAGFLKLTPVTNANSGLSLTSVLGGRVDTVQGFFKF